jgi:aminomethyltransferase
LAKQVIQRLTDVELDPIAYYNFTKGTVAGIENVIISNTGYTGAGGFELYTPNDKVDLLWNALFSAGIPEGIKPIGLGARDTLRLEMGFCLYGNDIDDSTNPLEAGLGWITKFNHPFMMSEHHKAIKDNKPTKKLVGFELVDKGIPRQHYPLCDASGAVIGEVTSGTMSPSLNKAIGLGYVKSEFAAAGSEIFVEVRGKLLKATVCKIPFS